MTAEYELELNGKRVEVTVVGTCRRNLLGKIDCTIERVLSPEGINLFSVVPQSHMRRMEARLWSAALEQRHPYGEGVDSAV